MQTNKLTGNEHDATIDLCSPSRRLICGYPTRSEKYAANSRRKHGGGGGRPLTDNNDLLIQVLGSQEGVAIGNWYLGKSNQVERLTIGAQTLSSDRVDALVQVMSTMTQPATSVASLSTADQARLQTALTAAWQG